MRFWDRCFGPGYGGPLGQAALREFCCDATDAFLNRLEPGDVAPILEEWRKEGNACDWGLRHWFHWITAAGDHDLLRSLTELISRVETVCHWLETYRTWIERENSQWDRNRDCRITVFTKAVNVLSSVRIGLGHIRSDIDRMNHLELPAAGTLGSGDLQEYRRFLVLGLVGFMQCAVESSFRTFLRSVAPGACSDGTDPFRNIYTCLLNQLGLAGKWVPLLDLWRELRNTVHNNGVYLPPPRKGQQQDTVVEFEGRPYRFEVGRRPEFLDWELLLHLTRTSGEMMLDVVKSQDVAAKSIIEDPSAQ